MNVSGSNAERRVVYILAFCFAILFSPSLTKAGVNDPPTPYNPKTNVLSANEIEIQWTPVNPTNPAANATGYAIERATSMPGNYGSYSQIAKVGVTDKYNDKSVQPGTCYLYKVIALNSYGQSPSEFVSGCAAKEFVRPAAPSNVTAKYIGPNRIDVSWKDNADNETRFEVRVDYQDQYGGRKDIKTVGPNTAVFSYMAPLLSNTANFLPDTDYFFTIYVFSQHKEPSLSSSAKLTTPPVAPNGLQATAVGSNRIDLKWTNVSLKATAIKIDRRFPLNDYTERATINPDATSFSDTGLPDDAYRYYRLRACNASSCSPYTAEVFAKTPGVKLPSNLKAEALSQTEIKLEWKDNSNNETGFYIEARQGEGGPIQPIQVPAGTTTYKHVNLVAGKKYIYRIRAFNMDETSGFSGEVIAATKSPSAASAINQIKEPAATTKENLPAPAPKPAAVPARIKK
jgi:hypothetical protein